MLFIIFKIYFWVYVWIQVPKEVKGVGSLELELHTIVTLPMWVLGTELKSSQSTVTLLTFEPSLQLPLFLKGLLLIIL